MEINHDFHAEFLCPETFGQDIVDIVEPGRRIDPDPVAYAVEACFFQQGGELSFCTCVIVEFVTLAFHLGYPSYIGSFCEEGCIAGSTAVILPLSACIVWGGGSVRSDGNVRDIRDIPFRSASARYHCGEEDC